MKKIVTLGAIAVLSAGFMFADEPAADVSITEFKGNAKVTWGMDLDAGKTGFKNTEEANFKVNLFSKGEKVTEGEGVWAELKIKTEGLKLENGEWKEGKASVDAAKLHINDFYVDIRSGDAVVGEYKFDGAIRSADADQARWISNVGPNWNDDWKYKFGVQAGYDTSDLAVKFDLRSLIDKDAKDTQYTNSYAIALEAALKDSNQWLNGLFANGGIAYNLSNEFYHKKSLGEEEDLKDGKKQYEFDSTTGEKKVKMKAKTGDAPVERKQFVIADEATEQNGHVFGYALNAGYKYKIDDKYFVKPTVAFAGAAKNSEYKYDEKDNKWGKLSSNSNDVAFGVILGWGEVADDNAGVYFLDGDPAKKVQPGVSVIVDIPLVSTGKKVNENTYTSKTHDKALAYIVPSFFTKGELVEGLKAGVYSEIALLNYKDNPDTPAEYSDLSYTKTSGNDSETWNNAVWKDEKFAFALASALQYDIKSGDLTITPKAGFRFANTAYMDNGVNGKNPLSEKKVFDGMGSQKKIKDPTNAKVKYASGTKDKDGKFTPNEYFEAGFLNLKAGLDIAGVINNTTFSIEYSSANLLNKIDYTSKEISARDTGVDSDNKVSNPNYNDGWKWYNVKLGTLDVGCKISF